MFLAPSICESFKGLGEAISVAVCENNFSPIFIWYIWMQVLQGELTEE
jgi:hypothetical protein